MKFSWNPIYFTIKKVTSCLLSTSTPAASHNGPLVLAGEQVQSIKEPRAPAATGAGAVGVVYTSVHLSFPLWFCSAVLLLAAGELQCPAWAVRAELL